MAESETGYTPAMAGRNQVARPLAGESLALAEERVQQSIRNGELVRVIVKPPTVANVVVKTRP